MYSLKRLLFLVPIVLGFVASVSVFSRQAEGAHPYHVSMAEVNWNSQTSKFEIALCVWPADLEKALKVQTGRSIDLDKTKNLDDLLQAYVVGRFSIVAGEQVAESEPDGGADDGKPSADRVTWYGHESDGKQAWMYFEIECPNSSEWLIENRVFFELNDDQLNHISWSESGRTQTLLITHDKPRLSLSKGIQMNGRKANGEDDVRPKDAVNTRNIR